MLHLEQLGIRILAQADATSRPKAPDRSEQETRLAARSLPGKVTIRAAFCENDRTKSFGSSGTTPFHAYVWQIRAVRASWGAVESQSVLVQKSRLTEGRSFFRAVSDGCTVLYRLARSAAQERRSASDAPRQLLATFCAEAGPEALGARSCTRGADAGVACQQALGRTVPSGGPSYTAGLAYQRRCVLQQRKIKRREKGCCRPPASRRSRLAKGTWPRRQGEA